MSRTAPQRRLRVRLRQEDGQALVEFALVLPWIVLLLFGALDLAKAYSYWTDSTHLANVGARFAAVGTVPSGYTSLQSYLQAQAENSDLGGKIIVTICNPTGGAYAIGQPLRVQVSSTFSYLPFMPGTLNSTISSTATNRVEQLGLPSGSQPSGTC
jgi:Flp pilus assembly protein TadG